jgi:polyphenol oxidase
MIQEARCPSRATFYLWRFYFEPMKEVKIAGLKLWQFESLAAEMNVSHFVSDRHASDPTQEFTLSLSSTPEKEVVLANRTAFAGALKVDPARLYFPSQVHLTKIVTVTGATTREELQDTDALITSEPGVGIAVMSADCVPVLLYDRKNRVIAAVHSGWRGTVARIVEKTLLHLKRTFGTEGRNVIAGIGPSVSQDAYEVGTEVIEEVNRNFGSHHGLFKEHANGKAKLDLWSANKTLLLEFGVPENQVEISGLCTVLNNKNFFSARKGDKGRFAAGIALKK